MQVICPNCGEKATAENINIQKMTAVCAACDTVFPFDLPKVKAKRRKVKPPVKFTLRDNESLQMEFWTNFRLDRSEAFLSSLFGGIGAMVLTLMLIGGKDTPFILPLVSLLIALALFSRLALTVVNKTHIEMDEESIKVTHKPIPNPFDQGYEVALAGVTVIQYEETAISKKEAFDTPRYRVWAEMADGSHRTIVNDVIEDYAIFIAQQLDERLHMDTGLDTFQVEDSRRLDDEADMRDVVKTSQSAR